MRLIKCLLTMSILSAMAGCGGETKGTVTKEPVMIQQQAVTKEPLMLQQRAGSGSVDPDLRRVQIQNVQTGTLMVVYGNALNSALWAYPAYNIGNYSDHVNWSLQFNEDETVTFISSLNSCATKYKTAKWNYGLTHNTCDATSSNQKFTLERLDNGAFKIKNGNECMQVKVDDFYFYIYLDTCTKSGTEVTTDFQWFFGPALEKSKEI